ncbi:glycosyltransferase [Anabaena minutissima FACHB-250]|nr:glycosyltransferase [Anabaena minutissima FACHB-250]
MKTMLKKFIIIDHSLKGLTGHHYEYDVSVAEAASCLGYEPVIISNKKFPKYLHPNNIKVIPIFTRDWTGISPFEKGILKPLIDLIKNLKKNKFNFKIKIRLFLKVVYEYLFVTIPYLRTILSKAESSLLNLKYALKSDVSKLIFPVYIIRKILIEIKSILTFILPIKTFGWFIKAFIGLIKESFKLIFTTIKKNILHFIGKKKLVFASEFKLIFKTINITSEDHIFIHTIGIEQLEELLIFLSSIKYSSSPNYHILLRRDCNEPIVTSARGIGLKACLNRFYGAGLHPKIVKFYTDTDELTKQHNALSPIRFITAPIPFRHENIKEISSPSHISEPINIVYLGDARPEKGYQYLPQLVDALWFSHIQPGKVKFTIQSNFNLPGGEPGMQEARLRLEQYPSNKVRLLKEPLSTEDYYEVLASADILVIPYLPESYTVRSSGVLVESLTAGKPVVVPAGSWMAKQVDESRASIYESPGELHDAVIKILKDFQKFAQSASDYRTLWRAKHSPSALVKCLIEKDALLDCYVDKPAPSIVYIIDGDSIVQRVGAGQVARNHLDYLSRCGYRVYGVFFFQDPKIVDEDFANRVSLATKALEEFNLIETWFLRYKFPIFSQANKNINYIISHSEKKPDLELELMARSYIDIPKSLKAFLQSQKLDAVLLNYIPSWSIVKKMGLDRYPVICEMHDIQSQQYAFYNNREVNQKEFILECSLLERCTVVLANNSKELEKVQENVHKPALHKVPYIGRLSPPKISYMAGCVDLSEVFLAGGSENLQTIQKKFDLKEKRSIDILYVSSYHYPNIYSLKWFFHKVYMPYLADKGVTFVIAGNIMSCGDLNEISHPNIFVAGSLESLKPIYAATRLVILPIKMGAGFNIKTIEALSMGKPVVATSMALRGLEFDAEQFKCFDEPEAYAARILELLENDETRLEQAKQGYELIQGRYDQGQYDKAMNAAFADALGESSLTPPDVEATYWQPQLVEWSPEIQAFNNILRQFTSQQEIQLENWELVKAHWELQGSTVFQELYSYFLEMHSEAIFKHLIPDSITDFLNIIESKLSGLSASYSESKEKIVPNTKVIFDYKNSYLNYYDILTNYDLFADTLARILKIYLSCNELQLGFVGSDPALLHLAYSLNEHGYVVAGFFGGENKTSLHPQQSLEFLNPDAFDVIFYAQNTDINKKYIDGLFHNRRTRVIKIPDIVTSHLHVLMSVDRSKFISCLNPKKLSVISLCNALAPKTGCFVECGVYLGGTTIYVAKQSSYLGINRQIFALDTFEGMPAPVEKDGETLFKEGLFHDNQLDRVIDYYKVHNVLQNIKIAKGLVQDTLPKLDLVDSISVAFLDMDQYSGTKAALEHIIPRLHQDGLIIIDDTELDGVDIAIKEALAENKHMQRIQVVYGFDILYNQNSYNSFSSI